MCGKFKALASWSEVVAFSHPLTEQGGDDGPGRFCGASHRPEARLVEHLSWLIGCLSAQGPQSSQHLSKNVASRFGMGT
jgi:hypothetical protein